MPKLDGFDVFKALQASNESETLNSKILVLSAQTEPHLVEELAKLGVHRTMTKPLQISELLGLVEEAAPTSLGSLCRRIVSHSVLSRLVLFYPLRPTRTE